MLYHLSSNDPTRDNITKVQESLRKKISERFTKSEQYKRLFGKELIREDLAQFVETPRYESFIRSQKGNENLSDDEVRQIQKSSKRLASSEILLLISLVSMRTERIYMWLTIRPHP